MATDILIKRSSTPGAVPTTGDLSTGELAINTADKRLFTNNAGTIVEIGTAPTSIAVTNNATVGGALGVTGNTTVATGTATNWTVTGTLTVPAPSNSTDAASKGYVDTADALKVNKSGDTMSGNLAMGNNKVTGLATPTEDADAATKAYVDAQVTAVIDSAPEALDTLNELAAALGDDANFATTVTNALAGKLALAGGTMTGDITLGANKITSTATPATNDTLTRKGYVDTQDATKLNLSGGTMTGNIVMGANAVTSTATPATDDTLTRKGYVDSILGSATDAATSASDAADSATAAANSASDASDSADAAAVSASNASDSADAASSSASAASSSATSASNSATAASNSASVAATSATNAENAYDSFDDRYLGAKASDPSVDNDGDALLEGALYFNSTENEMRVYTGSVWVAVQDLTGDVTVNSITATSADINGGTIDGVTIGGASAGAGTFTTVTVAEGLVHAGDSDTYIKFLANRIYSDVDGKRLLDLQSGGSELNSPGSVEFNTGASLLKRLNIANNGDISFYEDTGTTPKLFWDASAESLGIGTTAPLGRLEIGILSGQATASIRNVMASSADSSALIPFNAPSLEANRASTGKGTFIKLTNNRSGYAGIGSNATADNGHDMRFYSGDGSERMRIDSSGNLLVGKTVMALGTQGLSLGGNGAITATCNIGNTNEAMILNNLNTGGTAQLDFRVADIEKGNISWNNSGTSYNTNSDYRLKENVVDMTDAIDRVKALKPSRFNFISDPDTTVDGFIAHEAQEIVPEAVTGEKDAVDKDGKPEYQGIDQSKLVPLLTSALKEAIARIETLEAEVATLKGA